MPPKVNNKTIYEFEKSHLTPNIDIFTDITIKQTKKSDGIVTLLVSGKLTGDNFPCTEAFITDAKGTSVFLGVGQLKYGVDKVTGPLFELPGENTRTICTFTVNISVDEDGNFLEDFLGEFLQHNNKFKTTAIQKPAGFGQDRPPYMD